MAMRDVLMGVSGGALPGIVPWAVWAGAGTNYTGFQATAIFVAVLYSTVAVCVWFQAKFLPTSIVAGAAMLVGALTPLPYVAIFGAILGLPFAYLDWKRAK